MASRTIVRRQLRGFVTAWTVLTGFIAVATFFAIYLTYGSFDPRNSTNNIALPIATDTQQPVINATAAPTLVAAVPTNTPEPTILPTDEPAEVLSATEEVVVATEESVAVAQVSSPEPTVPAIQVTDFQAGIQVQPDPDGNRAQQDQWMRDAAEKIGFGWVKIQVRWEDIEPTQGEYNWGLVGTAINSANFYGLKVLVSVVTAPEWARESGVDLEKHGPPANSQDYVNFVTELLQKFSGKIHAVEVWNEQNLDREWMSTGGLNAQNYVNLLRQSYQAIKALDSNIIVISGALSPGGGWQEPDGRISAVDDFAYMSGLIDAGMLDYTDCVGVHHNGYNIGPSVLWEEVENDPDAEFRGPFENPHHTWSFRSTLEEYDRQIKLAGGTQKLCVTEFGWASTEDLDGFPRGFEFAKDNTLEEQKTWTIEALNNMDEWGFVWVAILWNFNYGPQAGWNPENDNVPYSIVGPDFVHRPVYDALVEWGQARKQAEQP